MYKLNKILTIGLLSILFSLSGYSQGTKIETSKLIISNDFEVISNANFIGTTTIGGLTFSSTNPPASTNWVDTYYLNTNKSPTMANGTLWTFSRGSVTNTATNGFMIINYKTGTNLFEQTLSPTVGNKELCAVFFGPASPYRSYTLVNTYGDLAYFIFSGTAEWGVPTSFDILAGSADGSPTLSFRLYDVTNAKIVAEYSNYAGVATAIISITNLVNIPTNTAIFSMQAKKDSATGNNDLYLSEIKLKRLSYSKR